MINIPYLSIRALLLLIAGFFTPATALSENISFNPDDSIILNPERGLAKLLPVGTSSIGEVQALRGDNHTIAWGLIELDEFRDSSDISGKMPEVKAWLDAVRASKVKTVLRVLYHKVTDFNANGATLDIQRAHMEQLGEEVLKPYQDVILALQAGGIGAFGEWYYAPPDHITGTARKQLLDSMFEASADDAFVMVRTPYYKQQYEVEGAATDRVARTAHYNDCFLSSSDDTGTYSCYPSLDSCPSVSALENLVANDSDAVLVGGETCNSTARNDCAATLAGMERFGYSFINTLYYTSIRQKWQTQGCFDQITNKLGYRLELIEADLPDSIVAGSEFSVSVTVKNVGWAPLYKERPVYIRMTDDNNQELIYYFTGADARSWLAGGQAYSFDASFTAPATLNTEFVSLSLWMPDNDPQHYRTPEYSIQMANSDVWNPVAGDNTLAAAIPVSNVSVCDQSIVVPSGQWAMLSLPCQPPGESTVADLFSDDVLIGNEVAVYGTDWRIYTYDPLSAAGGSYVDPGLDGSIQSGQGFWFVQITGDSVTLDLPSGSQLPVADSPVSPACRGGAGCYDLPLTGTADETGAWHMFGNPSPLPISPTALGVSTSGACASSAGGCDLSSASQANIISETVFSYTNGSYVRLQEQPIIDVWIGFWIAELVGAAGNTPIFHLPLAGAN